MATLDKHLDMRESAVNYNHTCGTIHCHGGWYAVAVCDVRGRRNVSFIDGAAEMARELGFYHPDNHAALSMLSMWAYQNPKIWGNERGGDMFGSKLAFTHPVKRRCGAENLQHIIDHWEEVYERVKELEEQTV